MTVRHGHFRLLFGATMGTSDPTIQVAYNTPMTALLHQESHFICSPIINLVFDRKTLFRQRAPSVQLCTTTSLYIDGKITSVWRKDWHWRIYMAEEELKVNEAKESKTSSYRRESLANYFSSKSGS